MNFIEKYCASHIHALILNLCILIFRIANYARRWLSRGIRSPALWYSCLWNRKSEIWMESGLRIGWCYLFKSFPVSLPSFTYVIIHKINKIIYAHFIDESIFQINFVEERRYSNSDKILICNCKFNNNKLISNCSLTRNITWEFISNLI